MSATNWNEWQVEEKDNLLQIDRFVEDGHTRHCACRLVWGDGECECEKVGIIPGPLSRIIAKFFGDCK